MIARDIMATHVVSVRSDATIDQAIKIMLGRHFSGLSVVNDESRLVGLVTEGDLFRRRELGTQPEHPRWLRFLITPGRLAEEFAHWTDRQDRSAGIPLLRPWQTADRPSLPKV